MRRIAAFLLLLLAAVVVGPSHGHAYINQADGTVVPLTTRLQQCLDLSEGSALAVDSVADATILPEAYRPVFDAVSGHYRVSFTDIGEGAGFRNSFGWFWIGEDVTDPANLHTVFGCRTYGTCDCPCATTRTVSVDFDLESGFSVGRQIGFWLRTPERLDGSREDGTFPSGCPMAVGCDPSGTNVNDSCGGRNDFLNRIYFTSAALNDDGDFVHFLVYRSATRTNTYYFGFEDLFRGGDNDYEDMLVRGSGLVPSCEPRPEACDNDDDDCDGLIDEGLTMACSTMCGAGTRTCSAGSFGACSARTPSTETCNNTDDDCDSSTDEGLMRACTSSCGSGTEICVAGAFGGCTARTPALESCNNTDDDCDGRVDEGLTRACASDCGAGIETCSMGTYGACSAPTPGTETCNADDDDCDGRVDEGLVRDCSNMCGTGTEVCRGGVFSGCTAPAAGDEACNNLDDDCDGTIDEGLTRACSTACGVGTARCVAGMFVDCDAPLPADETCNNVDDDCDGVIDDGNPGGGTECVPLPGGGFEPPPDAGMGSGGVICTAGRIRCLMGELVCQGATSGGSELCNCLDDDCDGRVDEETAADPLCPGGACVATECSCASPCDPGEFPCPPGRVCDESLGDPGMGIRGYCVAGRCSGVTCDMESVCNPDTGECENLCSDVTCPMGFGCVRGTCVEDSCYGRGCPSGQICRMDETGTPACVEDACATTSCGAGEFCRDGACVATCDVVCDVGSVCIDGACEDDPCDGTCGTNATCVDGRCVADVCGSGCGRNRVCRGGTCIDDPCLRVSCPGALVCDDGQCIDPSILPRPDAMRGLAAGGGGCFCSAAGAPASSGAGPSAALVVLALLGLGLARRRLPSTARGLGVKARALAPRVLTVVAIGAGAATIEGCGVDPFCFSGCDEERLDAAMPDAGRPDSGGGGGTVDGCVPSGDELCDSVDNDCDGLTDEDFDLESDPRNCGRCGGVCTLDHAFPECSAGECAVERCEIGWVDLDGVPANGCEYGCPPDGDELCDERDNDCDGRTDEGFDLTSEIAHCGTCDTQCQFPNGTASCVDRVCVMEGCNAGYVDVDMDPSNGCEYACTTSGGVEVCNGVDDDCDRMIDDGFDTTTDAANCGACGRTCTFPNATGRCVASACTFGPADCDAGFFDVDGDPRTGCEYMCTPTGAADTCNRVDDDCDGAIDEAEPMVGTACGTAAGACDTGTTACVRGALTCVGGIGPISEICNSADDDCDGRTDESVAPSPIPSVGDRCGATDVGICSYGAVACVGGSLTCSGAVGAGTESCNGLDDDCNGAIDNGLTTPAAASVPSCAETRGVCAGRTPTCRGAAGWACDLPALYQMVETRCDMLDNDCDGTPDEGCLRPTGADVRLDDQNALSTTNSLRPVIVASGSNVQLIWTETIFRDPDWDARVYYTRSTNNGTSFAAATRLNTTNGDTFGPQVMFGSTNVLWAWADFRGGTNYREIWTRRSTDAAGATPAAAEVRANGSGSTATTDSYNVRIALAGTSMFAAYEAFTTARNRHIFLTRSTDSGATWSAPTQVSSSSVIGFVAAQPRIAATGSRVYVTWRDNRSGSLDVFTRVWNVGTSAFVAAEQRMDVGTVAGSSSSFSADVAAEGTNAYVVWVDDRDRGSFDIWINRSTDSGATWLAGAVKLDGDTLDHDSIDPHVIAPDTGDVLVAWTDYRSGFPDPYVTRSTTAGASFAAPTRVDTGTASGASGSYDIAIAGAGNLVAMAWSDDRAGLLDVYANFSLDQGVTWQPQDYRLDSSTIGASDSQEPTVAVVGSRVHVAWTDHRRGAGCPTGTAADTSCSNGDIYYRRLE